LKQIKSLAIDSDYDVTSIINFFNMEKKNPPNLEYETKNI
jgi:hypothetical protein